MQTSPLRTPSTGSRTAPNPVMENLTVVNPDRVAVDLFSSAAPRITDLFVDQAGATSASRPTGVTGLVCRWAPVQPHREACRLFRHPDPCGQHLGWSGGSIQGITVDNCTGSSWAMVAGIWVEDSQPLLTNISIVSDTGIVIRHSTTGATPTPSFIARTSAIPCTVACTSTRTTTRTTPITRRRISPT